MREKIGSLLPDWREKKGLLWSWGFKREGLEYCSKLLDLSCTETPQRADSRFGKKDPTALTIGFYSLYPPPFLDNIFSLKFNESLCYWLWTSSNCVLLPSTLEAGWCVSVNPFHRLFLVNVWEGPGEIGHFKGYEAAMCLYRHTISVPVLIQGRDSCSQ